MNAQTLNLHQRNALARVLANDTLPHGSGINGMWHIEVRHRLVVASNTYSAMNQSGMYCHDYPFQATFTLEPGPSDDFSMVKLSLEDLTITDERKPTTMGDYGCGLAESDDPDDEIRGLPFDNCGYGLNEYLDDTLAGPFLVNLASLQEVEILQTRVAVELVLRLTGTTTNLARDTAHRMAVDALREQLPDGHDRPLSASITMIRPANDGWDIWVRAQTERKP